MDTVARKPDETVQVNLRIKESFRRKLEGEAAKHQVSLNKEMIMRLEDSFQRKAGADFEVIADDMRTMLEHYANRLELLMIEEKLVKALAKSSDPNVSKLAGAFFAVRQSVQHYSGPPMALSRERKK